MRFCPFCAQELQDDVNHCAFCGKRLPEQRGSLAREPDQKRTILGMPALAPPMTPPSAPSAPSAEGLSGGITKDTLPGREIDSIPVASGARGWIVPGARRSHAIGAARPSHGIGAARCSHVFGAARRSHVFGAARRSHAIGAARCSHVFGAARRSHVFGAARRSHAIGAARPSRGNARRTRGQLPCGLAASSAEALCRVFGFWSTAVSPGRRPPAASANFGLWRQDR